MDEPLLAFARQRVPVIMVLGSYSEASFAIKQAPEEGLTIVAWVLDGSATNDAIVSIIGMENTKKLWGYFNAPYFPAQAAKPVQGFVKIWEAKYGKPPTGRPNLYDMIGYGDTYICAEAIKNAGRDLSWSSLIASWEKLKGAKPSNLGGYDIVFPESYSKTDHQGNKLVASARIVDGRWRVVQ